MEYYSGNGDDIDCKCKQKPTKKQVVLGILFFLSFLMQTVFPNNAAAKAGIDITSDFCDEHDDLCNQHQTSVQDGAKPVIKNLLVSVNETSYVGANFLSVVAAVGATALIYACVYLPRKKFSKNSNGNRRLLSDNNNNTNGCYNLFKRLGNFVLPTRWDTCQLVSTILICGSLSIVATLFNTLNVAEKICKTEADEQCTNYANGTDIHEQHMLHDLAGDVSAGMLATGITSAAAITFSITLLMMMFVAFINYCTSKREQNNIERGHVNYHTVDSHL